MKTFLVLICSLALACAAGGAQKEDKSKKQALKKNQAQSTQHAAAGGGAQKTKGSQSRAASAGHQVKSFTNRSGVQPSPKMKGKAKGSQQITTQAGGGAQKTKGSKHGTASTGAQKAKGRGQEKPIHQTTKVLQTQGTGGMGKVKTQDYQMKKTKGSQKIATQQSAYYDVQKTKKSKVSGTSVAGFQSSTKTYKAKHFNLAVKTRPTTITGVTFQQNRRIVGSQYWQGPNYTVFRTYTPVWHERNWWNSHYNRVVFVFGGWYYWNAGWWYPAWGYAPNAYYAYDGPIYAYNDLPPDQVTANVQGALQEQGYYRGEVDGLLGPLTRTALADYQRDHGLYETAAIDRPTLESLRMA